jgi:hypothetical protein
MARLHDRQGRRLGDLHSGTGQTRRVTGQTELRSNGCFCGTRDIDQSVSPDKLIHAGKPPKGQPCHV